MDLDPRECYRAVVAKDRSRAGDFVYAVSTTSTVCKPGCRSRAPLPEHVTYFANAQAAIAAGYQPCKRCKPDAAHRVDSDPDLALAGEAMRLLNDGVVDDIGVQGTAERLGVDEALLNRAVTRLTGSALTHHVLLRKALSTAEGANTREWPRQVVAASSAFASTRALRRFIRVLMGPADRDTGSERP
jgi:AraC family transcriptional regulator, regulatory protein of adaptative response / DNA-3-methyladenine glycosylase II